MSKLSHNSLQSNVRRVVSFGPKMKMVPTGELSRIRQPQKRFLIHRRRKVYNIGGAKV